LLPYTRTLPKPLFTLLSRPIIEHVIHRLSKIGCTQIIINTHHLHHQIEQCIDRLDLDLDIKLLYEPQILETGGGIANAKPYLDDHPFFVINADIIFDIDLMHVYETHCQSNALATLVLHDYEQFNTVAVDTQGYVLNFTTKTNSLAFTGVQVLSPQIFKYFPQKTKFSSIEVYASLCARKRVKSCILENIFWSDIGTVHDYQKTSALLLCAAQFNLPLEQIKKIKITPLAGDGSDRKWFRANDENRSLIISDHGICLPGTQNVEQLRAFIDIGRHLASKKINVPRILDHDMVSGLAILEDLGDTHLADVIKETGQDDVALKLYKQVIDQLIEFSSKGAEEFNADWTCQTPAYSKDLILEKECRYFLESFVNQYLNLPIPFDTFEKEFNYIADQALVHGHMGLMHRDLQSKNIMVKDNQLYFIDFQSARTGPLQYDLASLLIDPYVTLNNVHKDELLQYTIDKLCLTQKQADDFTHSFYFCCLTRNLQFLGAFSFLTREKRKMQFEQYIPCAVDSLNRIVCLIGTEKLPGLHRLVQAITEQMKTRKEFIQPLKE
ncbi:MAG: phosphotransferase, partial [Proteobacteria bacterium]|nr:phosphotransferase [Pseudomonadota bacterium]